MVDDSTLVTRARKPWPAPGLALAGIALAIARVVAMPATIADRVFAGIVIASLVVVIALARRGGSSRAGAIVATAAAVQAILVAVLDALAWFGPAGHAGLAAVVVFLRPPVVVAAAIIAMRDVAPRLADNTSARTPLVLAIGAFAGGVVAFALVVAGGDASSTPLLLAALLPVTAAASVLPAMRARRGVAYTGMIATVAIALATLGDAGERDLTAADVATAPPFVHDVAVWAALAAIFAVLGALALIASGRRRAWLAATWFTGVFAGMLAVIQLGRLLLDAAPWSAHDDAARAALALLAGVLMLALGLLTAGLGERHDLSRRGLWRATALAVASLLLSAWLWSSLDAQRDAQSRHTVEAANRDVRDALSRYTVVRLAGYQRLADRLATLDVDSAARVFALDATALLAAVPGTRRISWRGAEGAAVLPVARDPARAAATDDALDERAQREAIARARAVPGQVAGLRRDVDDGALLTLVFFASVDGVAVDRAIVVDIATAPFVDALLATTAPDFDVDVHDDGIAVFARRPGAPAVAGERAATGDCARVYGRTWCWQVRATEAAMPAMLDRLPEIVLFGGLLTGALLSLALRLAVLARVRARAAERSAAVIAAESQAREQVQRELLASRRFAEHVLDSIADGFCSLDHDLRFEYVNPSAEKLLQRPASELIGQSALVLFPELAHGDDGRERLLAAVRGEPAAREKYFATLGIWLAIRIYPRDDGVTVFFQDITEQLHGRKLEQRQRRIIDDIASGRPLDETLREVVLMFEEQFPDALCSVLRFDDATRTIRLGAAPRLPDSYNRAIDGIPIGPTAGSCGTAIFRRERVIVTDIEHDPLWADFRALALPLGLRACWSQPLFDAAGAVLGTFAVYYRTPRAPTPREIDVLGLSAAVAAIALERAQATAAIATSEQRFRSLFDYHPDAVFALDRDGHVVECNAACTRLSRRGRDGLIGQSMAQFLTASTRMRALRRFCAALSGKAQYFAVQGVGDDGTTIPFDVTLLPIVVDRAIVGLFCIARDTSERERTQQLLAERDHFFELSIELFCIVTPAGLFRQVNAAFERVLGYEPGQLVGTMARDLVIAEDRVAADESAALLREVGRLDNFCARVRCADGSLRWVETSARLATDGNIHAIMRDVTDRKRVDAELARVVAELKSSNKDLQDFAFVASHDLQEPLRKIQMFGDRLRSAGEATLGEQGVDYLDRMIGAARRMQGLIEDLLAYSRVTTRGQPFVPVDLAAIARDVLVDLEARVEASGARVEVGPLPEIDADPIQMRQLLQNLLANALKFHPPERRPEVDLRAHLVLDGHGREWCELTVSDNGIGFDNRYRERIFAPFQRLQGRSAFEGTGMGLAIVRKIVERHGGAVEAEGTIDVGARFSVHLPRRQPIVDPAPGAP